MTGRNDHSAARRKAETSRRPDVPPHERVHAREVEREKLQQHDVGDLAEGPHADVVRRRKVEAEPVGKDERRHQHEQVEEVLQPPAEETDPRGSLPAPSRYLKLCRSGHATNGPLTHCLRSKILSPDEWSPTPAFMTGIVTPSPARVRPAHRVTPGRGDQSGFCTHGRWWRCRQAMRQKNPAEVDAAASTSSKYSDNEVDLWT